MLAIPSFSDLVDHLADSWHWWAAMGAFIASIPLALRTQTLIMAMVRHEVETDTVLPARLRLATTVFALLFMVGLTVMGAIIPFANDGRFEILSRESLLFREITAFVWLIWGVGSWGLAISLAENWRFMAVASVVWWFAVFVAVQNIGIAASYGG